jgi:peroxiredoxin family protein
MHTTTRPTSLGNAASADCVASLYADPPAPAAASQPDAGVPRAMRLAIIATKGTLDWAYPPLMLAVQAANKGWDVGVFFTFYGLNIIDNRRNQRLKASPVGNPAMPSPVPMPTLLAVLPGMTALATFMMRRQLRKQQVPTVAELLQLAVERGVKLYPCGFTIDMFGYSTEHFIAGAQPRMGSPDFLEFAKDADTTIFV